MQRRRDGLVPIGHRRGVETRPLWALQALREAPRPAQHHFTQADQVHQLVSASEADPDRGFMARLMARCSLPRTNRQPTSLQAHQRPLPPLHAGRGRRPDD